MSSMPEFLAERHHGVECITGTHEDAVDIGAPEFVTQPLDGAQRVIDAVLAP